MGSEPRNIGLAGTATAGDNLSERGALRSIAAVGRRRGSTRSGRRALRPLLSVAIVLGAAAGPDLQALELRSIDPPVGSTVSTTEVHLSGTGFNDQTRLTLIPGGPQIVGEAPQDVECFDVVKTGSYALLAFFDRAHKLGGFRVIDVADPKAPQTIGSFEIIGRGHALALRGDRVYVATLNPYTSVVAFYVVDISDKTHPTQLGLVYFPGGFPETIVLEGDRAYVADGGSGTQIVDIADDHAPKLLGTIPAREFAYGVAARPGVAFVVDGTAGLEAWDVSDAVAPSLLGSGLEGVLSYRVALNGDVAFVADPESGVIAWDVSDPAALRSHGKLVTPGSPSGLAVQGKRLYIADGPNGLSIADISSPLQPRLIGSAAPDFAGQTLAVAPGDGAVFLADFFGGLLIADVRQPASPHTVVQSQRLVDEARDAWRDGDRLYVAAGDAGLLIFDGAGGMELIPRGSADTFGYAEGIAVVGNTAFIADSYIGLELYDISDPDAPAWLSTVNLPGAALGVTVVDDIAYVADDARGLRLVDVSDPKHPQLRGFYDTPGRSLNVAVSGTIAYVADYLRGVQLVDVSDPQRPRLIATWDTPGRASGVARLGSWLLVADDFGGLVVLDVTDPAHPTHVSTLALPGSALDLLVDDHVVRVACGSAGMAEVAVDPSGRATLLGRYDTVGQTRAVTSGPAPVVVADGFGGIAALRPNPHLGAPDLIDAEALAIEVPGGFASGPYHLLADDGFETARLDNAFLVCAARAITGQFVPALTPSSATIRWPLDWSLTVSDPGEGRAHRARLLLPSLSGALQLGSVIDNSTARIEIAIGPKQTAVDLIGPDPTTMRALWDRIVAAGGIDLQPVDAGSDEQYGPLTLALSNRPSNSLDLGDGRIGRGGRLLASYSFEFELGASSGARLRSAAAGGGDADLKVELEGRDDLGCSDRASVGFRQALNRFCADAAAQHPEWILPCASVAPPQQTTPRAPRPRGGGAAARALGQ